MTSMQSPPPGHNDETSDLFGIRLANMDVASTDPHAASFGQRLHSAREARGLDLETCAQTLKLPARVLRQLERDQFEGIDSKVYLTSYIGKYARFLGINEASIQVELDRIKQIEAPLVATGGISHSRFLLDRYATAATYVVLTAVIVVPMVWLGVRGTLDRNLAHLAPLDAAPVAQVDSSLQQTPGLNGNLPNTPTQPLMTVQAPSTQDQPLLASMAPFPSLENTTLSPAQPAVVPAMQEGTGEHSLSLELASASWVEVIQADGTRLEYGLLAAGTHKTYHSDQALDVRIGNASDAKVVIDGATIGLDGFRRANVAHFRMQMQDGKASATSL